MCLHPTKVEGLSIFQRQDAGKKITTCSQKNPLRAKRILTSNYGTRYKNHVSPANIYIQLYILTRNKMVRRSSYTPKFLYWKNVLQGLFSSSLAARWPGNDSVTFQFSSLLRGNVEIYNANFQKVLLKIIIIRVNHGITLFTMTRFYNVPQES